MMDAVALQECCCDDHSPDEHKKSARDATLEPGDAPCCERSIEVGIDQESVKSLPLAGLTDLRSDVDPPQALLAPLDPLFPPQPRLIHRNYRYLPVAGQSGSETYLVTQRLRI
jgi:hypothetical protein